METNILKTIPLSGVLLLNLTVKALDVESLVSKISNKDIYILLIETTSPRIKGLDAKQLVTIGKSVTPNLINVLEDQAKGITAHIILSETWKATLKQEICINIRYIDNLEILILNGLEIHFDDLMMYATAESLHQSKISCEKIWKV